MEERRMKKKKRKRTSDEDRISKLPDDVIHQIMYFLDTRNAVQTSVLSKRWKLVWTTLPFLSFNGRVEHYFRKKNKFLDYVFSRRNHHSPVMKLELCPSNGLNLQSMKKYVKYAISHNVEILNVESDRYCSLSVLNSSSLKELKLKMKFESDKVMESDCWTLPNLTSLLLTCDYYKNCPKFPESYLTCLPALKTLGLSHCELPEFFSLPALTTLRLESATLPQQVWDLPALLSLQLKDVFFPDNMSDYFLALTSLRNLDIDFGKRRLGCCVISNSQLLNLKISVPLYISDLSKGKIVVLAPKLCNFSAVGFFRMRFEGSELENVNINFWDDSSMLQSSVLQKYQDVFKIMFSQLGSTKILTLDLVTLQALSEISDILVHLRSPFYNLKYLKLPHGYEESRIPREVREYFLSGSPSATIVKTLPPENLIPQIAPAVSVVDADKVRQIEAPVAGASNDRASSWENRNLLLWRGHEVNSEFVSLLDLIMKKYPQTFEKLPTKNKKIWTVKLNMLCSSVNAFTKTSMTEIDTEMLTEYRDLFTDLQRWGFNIKWLMCHLNYIEQHYELHATDSRVDNAKSKLQDLLTRGGEKTTDSENFRTMGTSLAATACYIGDGVL